MEGDSFPSGSVALAFTARFDEVLLKEFVRTHNERLFEEIFQRYQRMVMAVCCSILHRKQDAEDAAQNTWFALCQKKKFLPQGKSGKSWVCGIAWRQARNVLVSRIRREKHERSGDETAQTAQTARPLDELIHCEEQVLIDAVVQHLPEKSRICFTLGCLEGKSKGEVAEEELGLKQGTVASRIRRARKLLRRRVGCHGVTLSNK